MMLAAMQNVPKTPPHGRVLKLHRNAVFGEVSNTALQPQTRTKPPVTLIGTDCAINYLTFGVPTDLACRATGRGGARNSASRETNELSLLHVGNLIAAARHADAIGLPFTRMISIHWQAAGIPLAGMVKASGHFTDLLTKTLARHGSRTAWLWVHENARGADKGGHCHLLAHVPADLVSRLTGLQRGWLRRITGKPYVADVIHSKPIGGRLGLEVGNPDLHAVNLAVAFGYVCKGARQATLDALRIDRVHEPGGRVIGKRCGTSQNIGAKARRGGMTDG